MIAGCVLFRNKKIKQNIHASEDGRVNVFHVYGLFKMCSDISKVDRFGIRNKYFFPKPLYSVLFSRTRQNQWLLFINRFLWILYNVFWRMWHQFCEYDRGKTPQTLTVMKNCNSICDFSGFWNHRNVSVKRLLYTYQCEAGKNFSRITGWRWISALFFSRLLSQWENICHREGLKCQLQ